MCSSIFPMPCLIYYSRFTPDNEFYYSLTLELFVIIGGKKIGVNNYSESMFVQVGVV